MESSPSSGSPNAPRVPNSRAASASRVDELLDAAEAVIDRDGIASLTLDAVAAEAKVSKGGLLHHFPNKDRLIEALVVRTAQCIRHYHDEVYQQTPEGPGRMTRGLLAAQLRDRQEWCISCQRSSSAAFAALAHNPSLIAPMRAVYAELYERVAQDGLPEGVGDAVVAAIDGLWLYWVLGLMPVDQAMITRMRKALEKILDNAQLNQAAQLHQAPEPTQAPQPKRTVPAKSKSR